jgi:hypothetical protein
LKGVPEYIKRHSVDPTAFVVADMMSDEASGEEEHTRLDHDANKRWQTRVSNKFFGSENSASVTDTLKFFEIIRPNWRSEEVSGALLEY